MKTPHQHPVKRFSLSEKMSYITSISPDPIVRTTCKALTDFELTEMVGNQLFWKYLPDESFKAISMKSDVIPRIYNRTLYSHLFRVIEEFEISSIWRSRDLVGSCVTSLNEELLISSAALARSLIELTVTYGEAANFLRAAFDSFDWSRISDQIMLPVVKDEGSNEVNLELFIERLMSGTRIDKLHADADKNMQQRNIVTII